MSVTSVTDRYASRCVTRSIQRYRRYHTLKGGNAVTVTGTGEADALSEFSNRVDRLRPDHRDQHRFHEEKSKTVHALHAMSDEVSQTVDRAPWGSRTRRAND